MMAAKFAPTSAAPISYADNDVVTWLISGVPYAQQDVAKAYAESAYAWANCRGRKLSHRRRRKARQECENYVRENARTSTGGAILVYVLSRLLTAIVETLFNYLLNDQAAETAWHGHLYKDAPNVDVRPAAEETDPPGGPATDVEPGPEGEQAA